MHVPIEHGKGRYQWPNQRIDEINVSHIHEKKQIQRVYNEKKR
jgi:hypothetical protein